jgi:hypothetical protein
MPTPRTLWAGAGALAGAIFAVLLDFWTRSVHGAWEDIVTVVIPAVLALIGGYFAPASPVTEARPGAGPG